MFNGVVIWGGYTITWIGICTSYFLLRFYFKIGWASHKRCHRFSNTTAEWLLNTHLSKRKERPQYKSLVWYIYHQIWCWKRYNMQRCQPLKIWNLEIFSFEHPPPPPLLFPYLPLKQNWCTHALPLPLPPLRKIIPASVWAIWVEILAYFTNRTPGRFYPGDFGELTKTSLFEVDPPCLV